MRFPTAVLSLLAITTTDAFLHLSAPERFESNIPKSDGRTPAFINTPSSPSPLLTYSSPTDSSSATANRFTTANGDASTTTVAQVPIVSQRWRKRTKQLATLGPASSTKEMIEKLFLAGADVFRLNFSHGSQEQKKELLMIIREIEEKYSHPIGILGDLQGPKLRVCFFRSILF
jgi:Pyruvate kinase, barrel domain